MPYLSKAQQRWAHSPKGEKALGGKEKVAEWDSATKGKALPERVGKTKGQSTLDKLKRGLQGKKR